MGEAGSNHLLGGIQSTVCFFLHGLEYSKEIRGSPLISEWLEKANVIMTGLGTFIYIPDVVGRRQPVRGAGHRQRRKRGD